MAALDAQANSIMGLVDTLVASMNEAHLAKSDDWRQACFQAADNTIEGIRAALSATQVAAVAQPVAMTRAEVDRIVYACRQSGDDSTYAIVNAALAASPSGERQDVGGDRG